MLQFPIVHFISRPHPWWWHFSCFIASNFNAWTRNFIGHPKLNLMIDDDVYMMMMMRSRLFICVSMFDFFQFFGFFSAKMAKTFLFYRSKERSKAAVRGNERKEEEENWEKWNIFFIIGCCSCSLLWGAQLFPSFLMILRLCRRVGITTKKMHTKNRSFLGKIGKSNRNELVWTRVSFSFQQYLWWSAFNANLRKH